MGVEWVVLCGVALYGVALVLWLMPVHDHKCEGCPRCDDEDRRKREDSEVWEHKRWHHHMAVDTCRYCKKREP